MIEAFVAVLLALLGVSSVNDLSASEQEMLKTGDCDCNTIQLVDGANYDAWKQACADYSTALKDGGIVTDEFSAN